MYYHRFASLFARVTVPLLVFALSAICGYADTIPEDIVNYPVKKDPLTMYKDISSLKKEILLNDIRIMQEKSLRMRTLSVSAGVNIAVPNDILSDVISAHGVSMGLNYCCSDFKRLCY